MEGRESVTQEGGRRGWRGWKGESVTQEGGRRGWNWKGERERA